MAFQDITKTLVCLAISVQVMITRGQDKNSEATDSTVRGCNPLVDVAFVLDRTSSITLEEFHSQTEFIHDLLGTHVAPSGAVKVGYVVCEHNRTTLHVFRPFTESTFRHLKTVSQHNVSSSMKEQCIPSLLRLFKESGRHEVVQIALIIIAHHIYWNDDHTMREAKAMKEKGITLLVVTIGRRNFKELHTLRNVATSDDKFFVLSSFEDLKKLASDLSTGSCLPIALKPGSPDDAFVETTTLPSTFNTHFGNTGSCREVSGTNSYEKYIPFLGWLMMTCSDGTKIDLYDCNCKRSPSRNTKMKLPSMRTNSEIKGKYSDQNDIVKSFSRAETRNKYLEKKIVKMLKSDISPNKHFRYLGDSSVTNYASSLSSSLVSSFGMESSIGYLKSSTVYLPSQSSVNNYPNLFSNDVIDILMAETSSIYRVSTTSSTNAKLENQYFDSIMKHPSLQTERQRVTLAYTDIQPSSSSNYRLESLEVIDIEST